MGNYEIARSILPCYLYRDPVSHKGNPGYFDIVLPGVLLGLVIGYLGWQWSSKKVAVYVVIGGILISALGPIYTLVFDESLMWWLPKTAEGRFGQYIVQAFKAIVEVGVLAAGVRAMRQPGKPIKKKSLF